MIGSMVTAGLVYSRQSFWFGVGEHRLAAGVDFGFRDGSRTVRSAVPCRIRIKAKMLSRDHRATFLVIHGSFMAHFS
jgi:hypothetical protein